MKKEVFISLMETCIKELERKRIFDKKLEEALGGDASIISDLTVIEDIIKSICKEYKDSEDSLFDYIFTIEERKGDEIFYYKDKEYLDTIENNWKLCEGELD